MNAGRRSLAILFVLIIALSQCLTAFAQSAPAAPAISTSAAGLQPPMLNDIGALKAFVDQIMQKQIDDHRSPGGAIAIVMDGQVIFAQGYGYADVENRTPVSADDTLFRIGSGSKAFTATAAMQLAEQGRLSLDRDINEYLKDFKIPGSVYGPITAGELMAHTAGFEVQDACGKSLVIDPEKMPSLADYIAYDMPVRTRPAGEATSYSNYGMALEGYLIEQVTGISYDRYMDENIFAPLGMSNSTSRQPVPAGLAVRLAKGYTYSGDNYQAGSFEYVVPAPAGSISATAADMAHFMIARLDGGKYGNNSILNQSTAILMLTRQFSNDPRLNGMAYGLVETDINGKRTLTKAGDMLLFHSEICLVPDECLGIFVAFNGDQGAWAYTDVLQGFFDRYYPAGSPVTPEPMAGYQERASGYAGTYYSTRTAFTTIEKIVGGLSQQYDVTANPNGTISIVGHTFVETQPGYFEELNGTVKMVFRDSPDGSTRYLFIDSDPEGGSLVKAEWYQTMSFHLALLALCLLVFLSALIAWPVSWLLRRRKKAATSRDQVIAKWVAAVACVLNIGFVIGFMLLLTMAYNDLAYGVPLALLVVLTIPILAALLTIGAIGFAALAWYRRYWSLPGRIHYTIVAIALAAFLWFLNFWNLLGYRY